MFGIHGTGREVIDLGPIHPQDCDACGKEQPFRLLLAYRYEHLFFILGNVRARSYVMVCDVCLTPYRIPPSTALKLAPLDREPIPFLRRYGCLAVFIAFFLFAIAGILLGQ